MMKQIIIMNWVCIFETPKNLQRRSYETLQTLNAILIWFTNIITVMVILNGLIVNSNTFLYKFPRVSISVRFNIVS